MFGFFSKKAEKGEFDQLKRAVQTDFNSVKQDINSLSKWIKHLDSIDSAIKNEILELNGDLSSIKEDVENLKNMIGIVGGRGLFKQRQTLFNNQTAVATVLNSVQTAVQTVFFDKLSANERAIMFILLNSEMKLSYEDLAAVLGKRESTIRGQINRIKQKSEGLIDEIVGDNNKKRVFIPEKTKEILLKTMKVKLKKKGERNKKSLEKLNEDEQKR